MKKPIASWTRTLRALGFKTKSKKATNIRSNPGNLAYCTLEPRQLLTGNDGLIQVVDQGADWSFQYDLEGEFRGAFSLQQANNARGAAITPDGSRMFVINSNKRVSVFDLTTEQVLGTWQAKGVSSVEGIATDGNNIWIVDKSHDRVYFYENAAEHLSGKHSPLSHFELRFFNRQPSGITTDGEQIWVTEQGLDRVYVYQTNGDFLGTWRLDLANRKPTGIAVDPNNPDGLWVLDGQDDKVYFYENGKDHRWGYHGASSSFALQANNRRGEGIAISPASGIEPLSPPVIVSITDDTGSNSTDAVTRDQSLLISGTADPGTTVTVSDLTLGTIGQSVVDSIGNWTVDATATEFSDGTYQLIAVASDGTSFSEPSVTFSIQVDTVAPAAPVILSISEDTGAEASDAVTFDSSLVISGQSQAGAVIRVADEESGLLGSTVADASGVWVLDLSANPFADGMYSLTATAEDVAGNVSIASSVFEVVIDSTAPTTPTLDLDPVFDSAPIGDLITTAGVVDLVGSTEAGARVTLVQTGQQVTADVNGAFWFASIDLVIGENGFSVVAEDLAGNQSQFSQTITRISETVGNPVVSIQLLRDTGSSSRDLLTTDPTLTGSVIHPVPVTVEFQLKIAGPTGLAEYRDDITTLLQADGTFVLDEAYLATLVGGTSLPPGPIKYSARATDAAGNIAIFYGEFFLANAGADSPAITTGIRLLNDTGPVSTDKLTTDPTLVGFVEGTDIVSVEFFFDSAFPGFSSDITSRLNASGDFTLDQAFLENLIGGPLANQRHFYHLVATDAAGNFSFRFDEFGFLESDDDDITPPSVTFELRNDTGALSDDRITADVSLSGIVVDESGVDAFLYFYETGGVDEFEEDVTDFLAADGSFVIPQAFLEQIAGAPLVPGEYYFELTVTDRYTSTTKSIVAELAASPAAPVIEAIESDTGISNSDGVTNDATITIVGTSAPNLVIELTESRLGRLGNTNSDELGQWRFEISGPGLIDGVYAFTAVAISAAGQLSETSNEFAVTLDTDSPLRATFGLDPAFDTGAQGDGYTSFGVVTLIGSTTPNARVRLVNTGVLTVADADGNFSFDSVPLSLGRHVYEVETEDDAGNSQSSKRFLTYDQPVELVETGLVTDVIRMVELGSGPGSRKLAFRIDPDFVNAAGGLGDSLQVYLLDPTNPNITLLDRGQPGTAVFSLVDGRAEFLPGQVSFDGSVVQIEVGSIEGFTQGRLLFQLINNDNDLASRVTISEFGSYADESGTVGPVFSPVREIEPGELLDITGLGVSSNLTVLYENIRYESVTNRYLASVRLRNDGPDLGRTAVLIFDSLNADVSLLNASGVDSNGKPYVNLRPAIPAYGLMAGQVSEPVLLEFVASTVSPFLVAPVVLDGGPNTAPVLDPIGTINVHPGDVVRIGLSAADSDGEAFYYRLSSTGELPNLKLTAGGELVISPSPDQVGSYTFEIVATDGVLSSSQPVTLNVLPDAVTTTRLSGHVLDTQSAPLVGIPVELGGVQVLTDATGYFELSFAGSLPGDTLIVRGEAYVGPEVYPFIAEKLPLLLGHGGYANVNNYIERPIYLPALDVSSGVTIDPNVDVSVTTPNIPGASVFVAAGSLDDQSGNPFTGVLSITEVPADFTPAALPPEMFPDLVVTIQPGEMVFTTPAPLSLPNLAGYLPGTEMTLWSINPNTGLFDDVGLGVVSVDGSTIDTVSGGIRNSSWHFYSASGPKPVPPTENPDNEDKKCEDCEQAEPANSDPEPSTNDPASAGGGSEQGPGVDSLLESVRRPGPLDTSFLDSLLDPFPRRGPGGSGGGPGYGGGSLDGGWGSGGNLILSSNGDFGPYGSYDLRKSSSTGSGFGANVTPENQPLIRGERSNASDTEVALHSGALHKSHDLVPYQSLGQWHGLELHYDSERADARPIFNTGFEDVENNIPNPVLITKLAVRRGNVTTEAPGYSGGLSGLTGGENFLGIPAGASSLRAPLQVDLRSQPTGVYEIESSSRFAVEVGGRLVGPASQNQSTLVHVNTINSEFGAGWGLSGLTAIVENTDGSLLLVDGDGGELLFESSVNPGDPYISPAGDFSTMVRLPDGRFQRTLKNQTVEQYNLANKLSSITDRNGNQTQFLYNANEQIEYVIDPVGLTTTFRYADGRVVEIEDPAARITRLNYQNGDLISIEDPDFSQRQFRYDAAHRLIEETDKLGQTEKIQVDFAGRVESVTRKDGTSVQYSPAQTRGLYRPDQTVSLEALVPAERLGQSVVNGVPATRAQRVDASGNVTEIALDRQAQVLEGNDGAGRLPGASRNSDNLVERVYDGRGNLTVINYDNRGNVISVFDAVSRGARQVIATGDGPESVVVVDFDQDGLADVATANIDTGSVSVFMGRGDGTFSPAAEYAAGNSPASIETADFDGDGNADLVVVNYEFETISVLFGDGEGTFSLPSVVNTTIASSLDVGDVDDDGDVDIVVGGFIELTTVINLGNRSFTSTTTTDGASHDQVDLADFDNDGKLDLVSGAADISNFQNRIQIYSGNGDGTFAAGANYNAGGGTDANVDWFLSDLTTADLDGDGNTDVVATTPYTNDFFQNKNVSVFYGNGNGTFSDAVRLVSGLNPRSVEVADFDGDLLPDIITANRETGDVSILNGSENRTFGDPSGFVADAGTAGIGLGDLNGDGRLDLVAANRDADTLTIHLNGAGGQYFEYDPVFNQLTRTIDGAGRQIIYEVDPVNGDRLSMTEVIGEPGGGNDLVTQFTYTSAGLLNTATDPLGRVTAMDYDARGLLERLTFAVGTPDEAFITYEYDLAGNRTAVVDELGHRTEYRFDALNRLIEIIEADPDAAGPLSSPVTTNQFDGHGNLILVTDAENHSTRFVYDQQHRLVETIDADLNSIRHEYDVAGNLVATVDRLGRRTEFVYDARNRLVETVNAAGGRSIKQYDEDNNVIGMTDENGITIRFEFDARNRLVSVTDALGGISSSEFDLVDNLIASIDELRRRTSFVYDELDRVVAIWLPDPDGEGPALAPVMTSTYDDASNLIATTDALGNTTTMSYDDRDRMVQQTDPDPDGAGPLASPAWTYEFDEANRLVRMLDPLNRETSYVFDDLNRLVRQTLPDPDGAGPEESPVMTYTYDSVDNRTTTTDALGNITVFEYDNLYRVVSTIDPDPDGAGLRLSPVNSYVYDAEGQILNVIDPLGRTTSFIYDDLGRVVREILPDPDGAGPSGSPEYSRGYDAVGNATSMTDALGNVTRRVYDDLHRLTKIVDADPDGAGGPESNPVTRFQFDAADQLLFTTDPIGRSTQFEYDDLSRIVREIYPDPDGTGPESSPEMTYVYDLMNNRLSMTDALGNTTAYTYDNLYRLIALAEADPDGAGPQSNPVTSYTYDSASQLLTTTDPLGRTNRYEYDELGRVIRETEPDPDGPGPDVAPVVTHVFDLMNNEVSMTDALGNTTEFVYDNLYRLTGTIQADPDGSGPQSNPTTLFDYDAASQLISTIDPLGRVSSFLYDELGRVIRQISPDPDGSGPLTAPELSYVYDLMDNELSMTDAVGNVTQYEYDNLYRLIATIEADPDGAGPLGSPVTVNTYDLADQLLSTSDPLNRTTFYQYDDLGRVIRMVQPDPDGPGPLAAPEMTYEYDLMNNQRSMTDPVGNRTDYEYDNLYRVIRQIGEDLDGSGSLGSPVTEYEYDLVDNLLSLTDSSGNRTNYSYDDLDRLFEEMIELGPGNFNTRQFEYDSEDNLIRKKDRNDRVTEYDYDNLYRMIEERWLDQTNAIVNTIQFEFDQASQMLRAEDLTAGSRYEYVYDDLRRVTQTDVDNGGPVVVFTNAYDAQGRRTERAAVIGSVADFRNLYVYDGLNRLSRIDQVGQAGGSAIAEKRFDFEYNNTDQLSQISRFRDVNGGAGNLVMQSAYGYDGMGRLIGLLHAGPTNSIVDYEWGFDAASLIVQSISSIDGASDFGYDRGDQLTNAIHTAQANESYGYDEDGNRIGNGYATGSYNRLLSDGVFNYEYDAEGNRTGRVDIATGSVTEYEWDYRNRLVGITDRPSDGGPASQSVVHRYDVFNRWISKTVDADGEGSAVEVTTRYEYDGSQIILSIDDSGTVTNRYVWGPGTDQLLSDEHVGDQVFWIAGDHLGTVRDVVDSDGNVANHILYDSSGRLVSETNGSIDHLFGFTGRALDEATGLQNNLHRWYEAGTGRWLSEDPIGFAAGDANLYRYVGNDVLNAVDPEGLFDWPAYLQRFGHQLTRNVLGFAVHKEAFITKTVVPHAGDAVAMTSLKLSSMTYSALGNRQKAAQLELVANTIKQNSLIYNQTADLKKHIKLHGREKTRAKLLEALEYARLSADVYNPVRGKIVEKSRYKTVDVFPRPEVGFTAALYQDTKSCDYVLVFAGTNESVDWFQNFKQGLGIQTEQYEFAIELAKAAKAKFGGNNLTLAGHSLGGGLASAAAIVTELPAFVVDPAGVHINTVERHGADFSRQYDLINVIRLWGEFLTTSENAASNWLAPDSRGNLLTIPTDREVVLWTQLNAPNPQVSAFSIAIDHHSSDLMVKTLEKLLRIK